MGLYGEYIVHHIFYVSGFYGLVAHYLWRLHVYLTRPSKSLTVEQIEEVVMRLYKYQEPRP